MKDALVVTVPGAEDIDYGPPRESWKAAFSRLPVVPGIVILLVIGGAIFAPVVSPYEPTKVMLSDNLRVPLSSEAGRFYLLGTDAIGRDIFSRILYGARVSLLVAAVAVLLGGVVGVTLGLVSGYFGGWVDALIMRLTDISLSIPYILVALILTAAVGPSLRNIMIVVALAFWAQYARMVRSEVLKMRESSFVEFARVAGCRPRTIIWKHILPNVFNTVIVLSTLNFGIAILFESALSFLGMGIQPPTASWGLMLAESRKYLLLAWWPATFPGVAIFATVLGFNLLGDWLRDRLDPNLRQV